MPRNLIHFICAVRTIHIEFIFVKRQTCHDEEVSKTSGTRARVNVALTVLRTPKLRIMPLNMLIVDLWAWSVLDLLFYRHFPLHSLYNRTINAQVAVCAAHFLIRKWTENSVHLESIYGAGSRSKIVGQRTFPKEWLVQHVDF